MNHHDRYLAGLIETGYLQPDDTLTILIGDDSGTPIVHLHPAVGCSGKPHTGTWAELEAAISELGEKAVLCFCVQIAPGAGDSPVTSVWQRSAAGHEHGAMRWASGPGVMTRAALTRQVMARPHATGNPRIDALVERRQREMREARREMGRDNSMALWLLNGSTVYHQAHAEGGANSSDLTGRFGSIPGLPIPVLDANWSDDQIVNACQETHVWVRLPCAGDVNMVFGYVDAETADYVYDGLDAIFRVPAAACIQHSLQDVLGLDFGYRAVDVAYAYPLVETGTSLEDAMSALTAARL